MVTVAAVIKVCEFEKPESKSIEHLLVICSSEFWISK